MLRLWQGHESTDSPTVVSSQQETSFLVHLVPKLRLVSEERSSRKNYVDSLHGLLVKTGERILIILPSGPSLHLPSSTFNRTRRTAYLVVAKQTEDLGHSTELKDCSCIVIQRSCLTRSGFYLHSGVGQSAKWPLTIVYQNFETLELWTQSFFIPKKNREKNKHVNKENNVSHSFYLRQLSTTECKVCLFVRLKKVASVTW